MTHLTHVPRPPLSGLVESFWLYDGYAPPHAMERVLPSGTIEIVINLRGEALRVHDAGADGRCESYRGPVVCGAYSEHFAIDTAQQAAILGIHFKPGGLYPILGPVVGELGEVHVPLDSLCGAPADELWDRLLEAKTPETRFLILEQFLLARLARSIAPHPAVAVALDEFQRMPQARTVAEMTALVGLSPRRFAELFRREVGLTPKTYCRVRRFQEVLHLVERSSSVDWTGLALACGYYDQAHFNRDFRAFSGITPTAYLGLRGGHINHVPIPGRGQILPRP
jgi:AraC-like DNA-binding protein